MGDSTFFINGKYVKENEAQISILDHGFLYGDGIFEAFRLNNGKIFHFDDHMNRLYDSAKIIALEIPYTIEEFKEIVIETIRRSGFMDCYIRPQVTRGIGKLGCNPDTCPNSTVVVYVTPTPMVKKSKAIRAIVSCYRRPSSTVLPPESKLTQYVNIILAKIEAQNSGVDDAILLDSRGFVSEGCGWNLFLIKNGCAITPSLNSSVLNGITRKVIINLLRDTNIPVVERDVTLSELLTADEAFGTGTASEVTPILEINGRKIGPIEVGPITEKLEASFKKYIANNGTPIL
ncbi:MAG: branched-chain-amino-acid transaminase [Deltaproteobacteria bacterium]|nr:MAG: branched-chain-amino-acid transaminase [Deltaproteobacteria bacterium]RLC19129.1 MAG: branched-chain-amino-acid transaminase [Deltaproteobacteria bacterium]